MSANSGKLYPVGYQWVIWSLKSLRFHLIINSFDFVFEQLSKCHPQFFYNIIIVHDNNLKKASFSSEIKVQSI